MAKIKEIPVCSECGSDDIMTDAYARWDVDAQDWVLNSTHGNEVCENCGGECGIDWVPASDRDDLEAQRSLADIEQART